MDEIGQGVIVEGALADLLVEVDVLEHVLQRVDVGLLEGIERFVEGGAHVGLEVADFGPACFFGNVEGELVRVVELLGDDLVIHPLGLEILGELFALLIEEVGQPLQKQHAEDVFLVLRRIHVAAQVIAGAEDESGELSQSELGHELSRPPRVTSADGQISVHIKREPSPARTTPPTNLRTAPPIAPGVVRVRVHGLVGLDQE